MGIEQCTTEYTDECWDEHQDICHTHPECHTSFVDHCEPVFKKQCHGGGKKKGKKYKRDVAEELVHSEEDEDEDDDDDYLEDIKKMSTVELLDIMAEAEKAEKNPTGANREKRDLAKKIHKLFKRVRRKNARPFIMVNIARRFLLKTATMLRNVQKRFTVSARKFLTRNVGKSLTRNAGKYLMKPALMFPRKNAGMNHGNLAGMNLSKCAHRSPGRSVRRSLMSSVVSTPRNIARVSR